MTPRGDPSGAVPPWAVVLAGGDGTRLRSLTRSLYGHEIPKQFVNFGGPRSLLQNTLDRIGSLISPERTVVVVGAAHGAIARAQLAEHPRVALIEQPRNLGTGPGILFSLAHIRARAPAASVAIFPSDHHVQDASPLLAGVRTALAVSRARGTLALIGVGALAAETEYGWIVPSRVAGSNEEGPCLVRRFVEKPDLHLAARLRNAGALWNTFVMAGHVGTFWETTRRRLPGMVDRFDTYVQSIGGPGESIVRAAIYESLERADFSREVVENTRGLMVVPVRGSGWSDLGSPRRLHAALGGGSGSSALSRSE